MNLYLAGPMRGKPMWNFHAFIAATARLRAAGFGVISPAELNLAEAFDPATPEGDVPYGHLARYMKRDLGAICDHAHGIALLPGASKSLGAKAEIALAKCLGLRVQSVDAWLAPHERTAR